MITVERDCDICDKTTIVRLNFSTDPPEERIVEAGCAHAVECDDAQIPVRFEPVCARLECENRPIASNELCAQCAAEEAYWRREYEAIGRHEMEVAKTYREDLINAGRGHLLREEA